jgi:urease accessory protein
MDDGFAVLENRIEMREGSILEYLPESNVPFAGSKTYQNTEFHLDKGATLISFDMVTPGRVSRGEVFQYDIYEAKTKIYVDGKLIAYDSARIEPKKTDLTALGMVECRGANGTIYVYRDKMGAEAIDAVRAFEMEQEGDAGYVKFGATMVTDSLMIVRLISEHTWALENTMLRIWDIIRRSLLGKPAVRIRKY